MFILKRAGCRIFQGIFRMALPLLPYREPTLIPACDGVGNTLTRDGLRSALIVTTEGSVRRGILKPIIETLDRVGIKHAIYDKTKPDPTDSNIQDALSVYYESACDCLIAVGGGSVIDCAKAVGARVAYPKHKLSRLAGILKVNRKIPTLVAIPTTAGTGSEATPAAVVTDELTHRKYAIMSFPLIPHYAVLDPRLTISMPRDLTAATGMDALTHAVEAYIGRSTTRKSREMAICAIKLIFENIERAYADGNDLVARENMLIASYKAGVAFSISYVGYVHAIAHTLGGKYGTPHGLANARILPHVLSAYGKSAYKKLHRLALEVGALSENASLEDGANAFIDAVVGMNERMGIFSVANEICPDDIPRLAGLAAREANPLYPVPRLMDSSELELLYYRIAGISKEK